MFYSHKSSIIDKNVEKYLKKFEKIVLKHKPRISLIHLKKFEQNGKNFEFKKSDIEISKDKITQPYTTRSNLVPQKSGTLSKVLT